MSSEIDAVLSRNLPGYEVRSVVQLGRGLDHVAYEVNGELVVRVSGETDPDVRADLVRREADLLSALPPFATLPVPRPVFADADSGVLAYRKLPGRPLLGCAVPGVVPPIAEAIGEFVSGLHRAPVAEFERWVPPDTDPPQTWLADAESAYRSIAAHLPPAARAAVEGFLARTPPAGPRRMVFCHNDLGAEHLLVDAEYQVTGVIDWTDAAIADPAHDFARIHKDLGPEALAVALTRYSGPWDSADFDRTVFYARCLLLEDIAFGVETGARVYAEAALVNLDRVFAA